MAEQTIQVNRELKQEDAKEADPCSFDIISKTEILFVRRQAFASYQTLLPQV